MYWITSYGTLYAAEVHKPHNCLCVNLTDYGHEIKITLICHFSFWLAMLL